MFLLGKMTAQHYTRKPDLPARVKTKNADCV